MKVHFNLLHLILQKALVPPEHPLPAASEQDHRAVCPHHQRASPEQRPLHTSGPSAPDTHTAAPISRSSAAPAIPDTRARSDWAQAASADPEASSRGRGAAPPRGDSRGKGQGGLQHTGRPPLHDRLGVPAQCPHPAAGGRHPGADDRAKLVSSGQEESGSAGHWVGGGAQ